MLKDLPIDPVVNSTPVIATNRWKAFGTSPRVLSKKYTFINDTNKSEFVRKLLDYEDHVKHFATILITSDSVVIKIYTLGVEDITELDKEYAAHADSLYRDVSYLTSQKKENS